MNRSCKLDKGVDIGKVSLYLGLTRDKNQYKGNSSLLFTGIVQYQGYHSDL
ncbi:hypothetical protein M2444_002978 [Paenibacillus sp. PastF-3]|jgi:hypothetical protein|nr:hypothetical protein [Paenibacillus sp. PastF-3]